MFRYVQEINPEWCQTPCLQQITIDLPYDCIAALREVRLVLEEDAREHIVCATRIIELFECLLCIVSKLWRSVIGMLSPIGNNYTMSREVIGTSTKWFIVEVASTNTAE